MMEGYEFLMKVDVFSPIEDTPWYSKESILDYRLYGKAIGNITKYMLREYFNEDDIVWHDHYCPVKFHQSESWRSSSGF